MPPKKARFSADSSDVTSSGTKKTASSARTNLTSPLSFGSTPERKKHEAQVVTELVDEAASLELAGTPRTRPVTRSMTGNLPKQSEAPPPTQTAARIQPEGPTQTGGPSTTGGRQAHKRKRPQEASTETDLGSPWDPTPRRKLNVEDLDLDKSYVGLIPPPSPRQMPPRQPRWKHTGDKPLMDPKDLPEGWNTKEPDLAEDDIEGQIARCHERIADGIMPMIFEHKLERWLQAKEARDKLAEGEPEGLGWDVYRRLHCLKIIQASLEKDSDLYEELPNVRAVIEAYRSGQLGWNPGLVTYWSNGVQLCQPRPFDWDEFEAINAKHKGHKNFFTEPIGESHPALSLSAMRIPESFRRVFLYNIALRIPNYDWWEELPFIWDTGASNMEFPADDLGFFTGPCSHPAYPDIPILGFVLAKDSSGNDKVMPVIEVEATVLDSKERRMTLWTRTHSCLNQTRGTERDKVRLDGPLFRSLLYSATVPERKRNVYIATDALHALFLPRGLGAEDRKAPPIPPAGWLDESKSGSIRLAPRYFTPSELAQGRRPAPERAWGAPRSPPGKA